jgi:hypothetical protein
MWRYISFQKLASKCHSAMQHRNWRKEMLHVLSASLGEESESIGLSPRTIRLVAGYRGIETGMTP